jgi:hypothetical protein
VAQVKQWLPSGAWLEVGGWGIFANYLNVVKSLFGLVVLYCSFSCIVSLTGYNAAPTIFSKVLNKMFC